MTLHEIDHARGNRPELRPGAFGRREAQPPVAPASGAAAPAGTSSGTAPGPVSGTTGPADSSAEAGGGIIGLTIRWPSVPSLAASAGEPPGRDSRAPLPWDARVWRQAVNDVPAHAAGLGAQAVEAGLVGVVDVADDLDLADVVPVLHLRQIGVIDAQRSNRASAADTSPPRDPVAQATSAAAKHGQSTPRSARRRPTPRSGLRALSGGETSRRRRTLRTDYGSARIADAPARAKANPANLTASLA